VKPKEEEIKFSKGGVGRFVGSMVTQYDNDIEDEWEMIGNLE
jgi:hypothetical protein